jgi:IclR family acetate operon transcriptional repressor
MVEFPNNYTSEGILMKTPVRHDEVHVLIKSMNLLVCLAEAPLSVVDLSEKTGVTKPTVYRILNTLESGGFVVRDSKHRKYVLGPALIGLGRATRNSGELISHVRPSLRELREKYNETVNLGVLSHGKIIYLDTLESAQKIRVTVPMTIKNNCHTTALGRAILAAMPEESALKIIDEVYADFDTPNTFQSQKKFISTIRSSRAMGYAIDNGDDALGHRCIAAPLLNSSGTPIAAISLSAPASRLTPDKFEEIGQDLISVCSALKKKIPSLF